jgi:hypothetical protein
VALPQVDRLNPRDLARSTATSGAFHDVVVGTSKVIHGQPVTDVDARALEWARALIERAGDRDVMYAMPSTAQLEGADEAIIALRRVAKPETEDRGASPFDDVKAAVEAALQGDRTPEVIDSISKLRTLFAAVAEIALRSEVAAHGSTSWQASPKILPS